jgi:hypothetical protein
MSLRTDWEEQKKKLGRMAIKPSLFKQDLGPVLDDYEKADDLVRSLLFSTDVKKCEAAKKDRLKKSGKAAQIVLDYDNILKSELAKATPMQKIVINDALNTLTDITAHLRMTFQPQ